MGGILGMIILIMLLDPPNLCIHFMPKELRAKPHTFARRVWMTEYG
jgi:hypothetical protein